MTEPRNGLIVACHDDTGDEGNAWIRARIEEVLPDNKVKVFFLDYGHRWGLYLTATYIMCYNRYIF